MQFRVLGTVEAWVDDGAVDLGEPQRRLVLAMLIAHAGTVVSTDRLVDGVWGDTPPPSARKIVQGYVSGLRKAIGDADVIESRSPGYRLDAKPDQLDAAAFEQLAAEGAAELAGDPDTARRVLTEALGLWRGGAYEDLADADVLRPEIVRLEQLRMTAVENRLAAEIFSGAGASAAGELADLTMRHPLRERLWSLRMLALHRAGRQAEALRAFEEARMTLAEEVGIEPSAELRLLHRRILDQDPVLDTMRALEPAAGDHVGERRNPYKGLRPFDEADAGDFYGREALVRRLRESLDRRSGPRLIVLVGPSGSGKSSVVRAGLFPGLRSQGRYVTAMFPGATPKTALDAARAALTTDIGAVLLIDQFEEAFAVAGDIERDDFLSTVCDVVEAERGPWVVVTIRADFLGRLLAHPRLALLVEPGMVLVTPLQDHEVRDIVVRPASQVGVSVQPELVAAAMRDIAGRPEALPLLEYALTDLFDRSGGGPLTYEAYAAAGGIAGSLTRRAEELYLGLDPHTQRAARRLFLQLVTVTEDGEPLRRRVASSSLSGEQLAAVLDVFAEHRLLTFDRTASGEPTVEVAHEALLTQWPRLAGWIDDARDDIHRHRRLADAASEWVSHGRATNYLLTGGALARFSDAASWDLVLTPDEEALLRRSTAHDRRRRRMRTVLLGTAAAVFAVLALVAFVQRRNAQHEARVATAQRLAVESKLSIAEDPERAILLALEAVDTARRAGDAPLPEAVGALHEAVQASRLVARLEDGFASVAVSPDGSLLATDSIDSETGWASSDVILWDAATGARLRVLDGDAPVSTDENRPDGGAGGRALAFSPDGSRLAVAYQSQDGSHPPIVLWDPATGARAAELAAPGWVSWDPTWTPDGRHLVAASWDGETDSVTVWDASGGVVATFQPGFVGQLGLIGGDTIVVGHGPEERVGFYSVTTGEAVESLDTPGVAPVYLAVDPEGRRLAVAGRHEQLEVWDLGRRRLLWARPISSSRSLVVSPDGNVLALAGDEGLVRLLSLEDGEELMVLAGHRTGVWGTAFHPDGRRVSSVALDGETRTWDVSLGGPPQLGAVTVASGRPFILDFSPDGAELGVSTWDGSFERHAVADGALLGSLDGLFTDAAVHPVISRDWRLIAAVDDSGAGTIRLMDSMEPVAELPPCTDPQALNEDGTEVVLDGLWLCLPSDAPPGAELRSRVVDLATGEELIDLGERVVFRADFSPDTSSGHRYLAVNLDTETLEIYDLSGGELVAEYDVLPTMIRFDPSGRYLASGTLIGGVVVIDIDVLAAGGSAEDAVVMDRTVATGGVPGIAVTADGIVATAAFDSSFIRLWKIDTGELVAEITTRLDGSSPPQLNFSPDGSYLMYPDAGRVLRRFPLDTDSLITLAEQRVTRTLTADECVRFLGNEDCDTG